MSDLVELERRLTAAMARIAQGVEALGTGPDGQVAELEAAKAQLETALEEEKTANAQLEARVQVLKEREAALSEAADQMEALKSRFGALDQEVQGLKAVNAQLRENNQALRAANRSALPEPELINRGMQIELEALKAERDLERQEVEAVIAELKPLVEGAVDAAG